jgi:hypothetical protein
MGLLNKDQILAADDLPYEDVEIPEWGGTVRIRTMTGAERDAWEAGITVVKGGKSIVDPTNFRAKLVVITVVDDEGNRIFSDGDAPALGRKNGAALDRAYSVSRRLNGITSEDEKELAKN